MKNLKLFVKVLFIFCLGFVCGLFYILSLGKRYDDTKIGDKISRVHDIWSRPDLITSDKDYFYHKYTILFANEYVFIFNAQDSTLLEKWKEN